MAFMVQIKSIDGESLWGGVAVGSEWMPLFSGEFNRATPGTSDESASTFDTFEEASAALFGARCAIGALTADHAGLVRFSLSIEEVS